MKKHLLSVILLSVTSLSSFVSAQQNPIEILLDDTTLGSRVEAGNSVTSDGVTMTVTKVVSSNGGNRGEVEGTGILFGTHPKESDVASLGISFNVDIRITGYEIGAREDVPSGIFMTITGPNGTSAPNPVPSFSGSIFKEVSLPYVPGNLPVLKAGETYTITHNLLTASASDALFNLEALFVTPDAVKSSDASLSKLALRGAKLKPKFRATRASYTVQTARKSLRVRATAATSSSKIRISGKNVKSGKLSKAIRLKNKGKTRINIVVTAQDGSKQTYRIIASREK